MVSSTNAMNVIAAMDHTLSIFAAWRTEMLSNVKGVRAGPSMGLGLDGQQSEQRMRMLTKR